MTHDKERARANRPVGSVSQYVSNVECPPNLPYISKGITFVTPEILKVQFSVVWESGIYGSGNAQND